MMLPTSVRRIATAAAPQSPLLASFAPTATRASAALALTSNPRCNQRRRYSSSKPSGASGSSKDLPDGQVTASSSPQQSSSSNSKQASGEKRTRRKQQRDLSASPETKLPSVPSTQNVPQEALALSTFFSLHRPISVTHSFPRTITDDAFAQIFASSSRARNITTNNSNTFNEVMSTLSQTVDQLEQPMQGLSIASEGGANDAAGAHKINLKHPDGTESSVYVQLNNMSGQFLPFRPPPLPQPLSESQQNSNAATSELAENSAADVDQQPQTRVYKAMFTLEETIDANGDVRIVAHSPQLVEDEGVAINENSPRRSFLERMAIREIRRNGGQAPGMLAISVKRQRKLRMKKKKYKKLMRRTRNERRKLDRI
ncbi:hypothetical protein F5Y16DRAFT_265399 [Xylariaceae sp. FL0255]|nr:hypothetical protein F5Y16DRAFT_265399 [Xylariaceae sp. FL0255]